MDNIDINTLVDIQSLYEFETEIAEGVSLFFFHATWCSRCASQRPAIEGLPGEEDLSEVFCGEVDYAQVSEVVSFTGLCRDFLHCHLQGRRRTRATHGVRT
jgi:hypothetical protein